MTNVADTVNRLRTTRANVLGQLERVTEEEMTHPVPGRQAPTSVRFMFYRLIAHEAEHTVHLVKTLNALGIAQTEAQLILHKLQAARGELEGLLVGLSDEDLDRVPATGGWSPRQVLDHIVNVEEEYSGRIVEALRQEAHS